MCLCVCLSVCLSVCLCVCLSGCLSVSLFVLLSVGLFVCLFVCWSFCLSVVCLFVCLSVCLSFCLSACLFVCLSACLSVCQIFIFYTYELLQAIDTKVHYISIRPIWVSKKLSTYVACDWTLYMSLMSFSLLRERFIFWMRTFALHLWRATANLLLQ